MNYDPLKAIHSYIDSSGVLCFDSDAWKRSQHLGTTSCNHSGGVGHLALYLREKALAEPELDSNPPAVHVDQAVPPTELVAALWHRPGASPESAEAMQARFMLAVHQVLDWDLTEVLRSIQRRRKVALKPLAPMRPDITHADLALASLALAHWDLTEHSWSLEHLADNLAPAWTRSCRLFTICAIAKGLQLCFWPSFEEATAVTVLTVYHAGFALFYQASLRIVSRCRRHVEQLKEKVSNQDISDEDVRVYSGIVFTAANWIAECRDLRQPLFCPGEFWRWPLDFIANLMIP